MRNFVLHDFFHFCLLGRFSQTPKTKISSLIYAPCGADNKKVYKIEINFPTNWRKVKKEIQQNVKIKFVPFWHKVENCIKQHFYNFRPTWPKLFFCFQQFYQNIKSSVSERRSQKQILRFQGLGRQPQQAKRAISKHSEIARFE